MKTNYKKVLKFVTLLMTSLLIATASATIYDYMNLNANVGVYILGLKWTAGEDAEVAGTQINGATATLANLQGPPNGTRIYADPVRLNNTGSTVDVDLLIDTVSGNTDHLKSIIIRIYNFTNGASIANVTVWSDEGQGSSLVNLQIPAGNVWRFQWEITWKSTATTTDSVTVNLRIRIPA